MLHPHQILMCNLKVTSGWLLTESFCSPATAQLHNVFWLNREAPDCRYCDRISASNFDTAKVQYHQEVIR